MKWLILSVLAAAVAACATAPEAAPAKSVAADAAPAQVCRRMTATASHVSKRVCRAQEEWDASDQKGRSDAELRERLRRDGTNTDSP